MCACGKAVESGVHKEERDVLLILIEMRKIDECDVEKPGTLDSSEQTTAILLKGDRWWPQTATQEGDMSREKFPCDTWKKRNERPMLEASNRSRNGMPSRKGCLVNGQMTQGKQLSLAK